MEGGAFPGFEVDQPDLIGLPISEKTPVGRPAILGAPPAIDAATGGLEELLALEAAEAIPGTDPQVVVGLPAGELGNRPGGRVGDFLPIGRPAGPEDVFHRERFGFDGATEAAGVDNPEVVERGDGAGHRLPGLKGFGVEQALTIGREGKDAAVEGTAGDDGVAVGAGRPHDNGIAATDVGHGPLDSHRADGPLNPHHHDLVGRWLKGGPTDDPPVSFHAVTVLDAVDNLLFAVDAGLQ